MLAFTVYTKSGCSQCEQAKALLTAKKLPFNVIHLDEGQPQLHGETYVSREELLARIPTARTMPQIVREDNTSAICVGGFSDLKRLLYL